MELEATSNSMLSGVGRNDSDAWQRFYDRYKVLIYLRGRHYGFSDADIDDLLGRVMSKCFTRSGSAGHNVFSFDPSKGRFRDYFCRIVNNEAITMLRERKRLREVPAETPDGEAIDFADPREEASTQAEYQQCLLNGAFQQVRKELLPRIVQAFIAVRIDGIPAGKVAKMQGVSLATVYNDIAAMITALKQRVKELEEE